MYILHLTKEKGIIFINLQKDNSNYLPFELQCDFLKNQVPILVYKDFWRQELTNQIQPYCRM